MSSAEWLTCTVLCLIFISTQAQYYGYSAGRGTSQYQHGSSCLLRGSTCTFSLVCLLSGGQSTGSCGNSVFYTCCTPRVITIRQNAVRRQPALPTSSSAISYGSYGTTNPTSHPTFYQRMGYIVESCGKPAPKPQSRIVGGEDAHYGEFPWQAHIKISKQQCGGALVSAYFVLTAAHCVFKAHLSEVTVILGAYDIQDSSTQLYQTEYLRVVEKKIHPYFRFSPSHPDRYDIALLRLEKPIQFRDHILPICLPPSQKNFEGWRALVTGWGKTDPALSNRYGTRLLQKVDVPIITNEECEAWHRTRGINLKIFPEMMCAGYEVGQKDACVGDSGGPLITYMDGRWTLVGITSAGFGCAQSRQPGIYHRVSLTVDWILENIY